MIEVFKSNRRAAVVIVSAFGVLLLASALSACQIEDLIKIEIPKDVATAIDSEPSISVADSSEAWEDWEAYVERESRRFAAEIDRGREVAGVIRSLTETGISIGQDAASTLPGGAILGSGLALLGGLLLKRPGDAKKEQLEKEASYNAGIQKGHEIAENVRRGIEAFREAETPPEG
jgi:hypothetical protein